MKRRTDIAVILVGRNTRRFVRDCFRSVTQSRWDGYSHELVYVDNASSDGSVDMVRDEFPQATIIANDTNTWFCHAANQGARAANSRYHLQLNNDTLVEPDAIARLASYLDAHPEVSAAGGRVLNPDGTDQWSARRFPRWVHAFVGRRSVLGRLWPDARVLRNYLYKAQLEAGAPFEVEWTPTVYMMLREEVYRASGGFPEELYYWHEAVYCDRLRRRGGRIDVVPASRIVHFEGQGGGPRPYTVRRWHIIDFHRGAYRFFCEHYRLSRLHPGRWLAASALSVRAGLLLARLWWTRGRRSATEGGAA
jgi:GT2 family glycosyltransferase